MTAKTLQYSNHPDQPGLIQIHPIAPNNQKPSPSLVFEFIQNNLVDTDGRLKNLIQDENRSKGRPEWGQALFLQESIDIPQFLGYFVLTVLPLFRGITSNPLEYCTAIITIPTLLYRDIGVFLVWQNSVLFRKVSALYPIFAARVLDFLLIAGLIELLLASRRIYQGRPAALFVSLFATQVILGNFLLFKDAEFNQPYGTKTLLDEIAAGSALGHVGPYAWAMTVEHMEQNLGIHVGWKEITF